MIAIFLLVTGWFFFSTFFLLNQASLRNFFGLLPVGLRLRGAGRHHAPVRGGVEHRLLRDAAHPAGRASRDVVARQVPGQRCAFVAAMLVPTLAYPVTVALLGALDWGPVVGGYLGALLLGAAFAAVGLFASALTRNQIVAFIVGLAICFGLTLVDQMALLPAAALCGSPRLPGGGRPLPEHRQGRHRHARHRLFSERVLHRPLRHVPRR
ncbi:MAG: hypothetical protein MZU91_01565 [Desulfosudis oleivorans]|nr:hypothetical protein [Desulfosudis oleivorans]